MSSWYVYGEFVIDRILHRRLVREIKVFFEGSRPDPEVVRKVVGLSPSQSLHYTNVEPTLVCNLDDLIIDEQGRLTTLLGLDVAPALPKLRLLGYELPAEAVVRLSCLLRHTPQIEVDEALRTRLAADERHIAQLGAEFPELASLIESTRSTFIASAATLRA